MSATIYRVIRESYYNGGGPVEVHETEVLYCGTDRDDARIAYHTSEPRDHYGTPGNHGTRTRFQQIRERSNITK